MRLGILIPNSWNYSPTDSTDSITTLIATALTANNLLNIQIFRANSGSIDEMRNTLVIKAIDAGCTHVLFLDADMVYPPETIPKMVESMLEGKLGVLGGLTFRRWPPYSPLLMGGEPYDLQQVMVYDEGVVPVTATGAACLMIDCEVFKVIEHPWFKTIRETKETKRVGEDIYFCYQCWDKKIPIYVDTTIKTDHLFLMRANEQLWKLQLLLKKSGLGELTLK